MLSKTIECLSRPLVAHKEESFFLFHLLFGVVSGSLQSFLACYGLFRFVSLFTSDDVIECFDVQIYYNSTSCRFYNKVGQFLRSGVVLIYTLTRALETLNFNQTLVKTLGKSNFLVF